MNFPLDGTSARAAALLCGHTATRDVIDASVTLVAAGLARHGDAAILTSDAEDLVRLSAALDGTATIVKV